MSEVAPLLTVSPEELSEKLLAIEPRPKGSLLVKLLEPYKDTILAALERGLTRRKVYEVLTAQGLKCHYVTYTTYLKTVKPSGRKSSAARKKGSSSLGLAGAGAGKGTFSLSPVMPLSGSSSGSSDILSASVVAPAGPAA